MAYYLRITYEYTDGQLCTSDPDRVYMNKNRAEQSLSEMLTILRGNYRPDVKSIEGKVVEVVLDTRG